MIGLYYREGNERSQQCLCRLKKLLDAEKIQYSDFSENKSDLLSEFDLLIVFGGDGSVLRAAKFAESHIPIVAINTGNVGFLTSYEENNLEKLVSDIKNNKLTFSKRKFMSVTVNDRVYLALNDAVVQKNYMVDSRSECVRLGFSIDDQFVDSYVADGLIVSTPTGSTAYAISAGGPIMVPDVNAYVAAPICAHTLHSKPIVYCENQIAKITVNDDSKTCALFIDGQYEESLAPGTIVIIKASDKFASICENAGTFFSRLSRKLNKWSINDLLEVDNG